MPVIDVISTTAKDLASDLAGIGIQLDGSAASLAALDEAIATIWGSSSPPEDLFDGMAWGYGCYVADVIQRHHAGEWQPSDDIGYDFILSTAVVINPWVWVEKRFQTGESIEAKYRQSF